MPDPNTEHGLRVQLATALRERDEARAEADKQRARRNICQMDRNAYELQNNVLRADVKRLREALQTLRASVVDCAGLPQAMDKADAALATGGDRG